MPSSLATGLSSLWVCFTFPLYLLAAAEVACNLVSHLVASYLRGLSSGGSNFR